jgi:hypothetical protein
MLQILIAAKDEVIAAKQQAIINNEIAFKEAIAAKQQTITNNEMAFERLTGELIANKMKDIKMLTTRIYDLQGRLSLRAVQEDTEAEFKELPLKKGESRREQAWRQILSNKKNPITQKLLEGGREIVPEEWVTVAKNLYKKCSANIHNYQGDFVVINTSRLTQDEITLAKVMCECLPIEFQMFSPSSQTSDDDII